MVMQNLYISNFSKLLFKIIIPYFVVILIIGFIINYSFEKFIIFESEISGAYKVNRILNYTFEKETIIVGSSRARGGIVPEIVGNNVFNYGIDGTGYNYINFVLHKELNKRKKTPIIIVLDYEWDKLGIGETQYYIPNSNNPFVSKLFKDRFSFYHYIPFFKYFGYYEENTKYFINNQINLSKYNNNGGSFELFKNPEHLFNMFVNDRQKSKLYFTGNNITVFDSLVKSTKRDILIAILPYHKSYLESIVNENDIKNFKDSLLNYKNIKLFDYSKLELNDSLYFNTTHLNYDGAKHVSMKFRKDLDSLNIHL